MDSVVLFLKSLYCDTVIGSVCNKVEVAGVSHKSIRSPALMVIHHSIGTSSPNSD